MSIFQIGLLFQPVFGQTPRPRAEKESNDEYAKLKKTLDENPSARSTDTFRKRVTAWLVNYTNNRPKDILNLIDAVKSGNRSAKGADLALAIGVSDLESFLVGHGFAPAKIAYYKAEANFASGAYAEAIRLYTYARDNLTAGTSEYSWSIVGIFNSKLRMGGDPSGLLADFKAAYAVHPTKDKFAYDTVSEFANRFAQREDLGSLSTALAIYEALAGGGSLPSQLSGYPVGSGGSAGNLPKTIAGLKIKIAIIKKDAKGLEDSIRYCINSNLFEEAKWALWEKIDLPYKNSPESIPDRLQLALIFIVALANNGSISLNDEPWKTIAAMDMPNKSAILSATIKTEKPLKERLSLAYLLSSIAAISKRYGLDSQYDPKLFKEASAKEYAKCEQLALEGIRKKPAEVDNYLDLATVYTNIGGYLLERYQDSRDEADKKPALEYLNKAGALYQKIVEGDFAFPSDGLGEINGLLNQNLASLRKAIKEPKREKDLLQARINYTNIIMQTGLRFSEDPEKITTLYTKILGMFRALKLIARDDQLKAQIDSGALEANQLFATAFIRLNQPEKIFAILEKNIADIFADRSIPKSKPTDIFGASDDAWKAFFVDPGSDRLEFIPNAEQAIQSSGIDKAKKQKLLSLLYKYQEKAPDYAAALGNISILAWAHEVYAEKTGDTEQYRIAAAIFKALLYGEESGIASIKMLSGIILKNRGELMKDNTLKTAKVQVGQLHLMLARDLDKLDDLRGAENEYTDAVRWFKDDPSALWQYKLLEAGSEFLAFRARNLIEAKKYKEAYELLNGQDLKAMEADIKKLALPGNTEDIFRSYSTLAWIHGMRATVQDKLFGEGAGKAANLEAVRIYKTLLADPKISDEVFLAKMNTSTVNLWLSIAGHLQAAGVLDEALLKEALSFYDKALGTLTKVTVTNKTIETRKVRACLGKAETRLMLTRLTYGEKTPAEIQSGFNGIFSNLVNAFNSLSKIDLKTTDQMKDGLRFIKALNWALSMKGDHAARNDTNPHPGKVYPEKALLLVLGRILIKGEFPASYSTDKWREIYRKAEESAFGIRLDLGRLLYFLQANRSETGKLKFVSEKVLSGFGASRWSFNVEYINNLFATELYIEGIKEYQDTLSLLDQEAALSASDYESSINLHAQVGDTFNYKLNRGAEAKQAYDRAYMIVGKFLAAKISRPTPSNLEESVKLIEERIGELQNRPELKPVLAAVLRILSGYGKIASEEGDGDRALQYYSKIIGQPMFEPAIKGESQADIEPDFIKILVPALLAVGDIYNYKVRDIDEAVKQYLLARFAAGLLPDKGASRRYTAQTHLGIGDVYRLRKLDHENAIKEYGKGIEILEREKNLDNEGRKALSQLYASMAVSLAQLGKTDEARKRIDKAGEKIAEVNTEFDPDLRNVRERIESARVFINQKNAAGLVSLEFKAAYVRDTYHGETGDTVTDGFSPYFGASFMLARGLKLNLNYNLGLERGFTLQTAGMNSPAARLLINRPHTVSAGVGYNYDGDSYNFRAAPSFLFSAAPYTVNRYRWDQSFSNNYGANPADSVFYSGYLGLNFGMDYKYTLNEKSLLMFGLDAAASFRLFGSESPLTASKKQDIREFTDRKKADPDKEITKADEAASYDGPQLFSFAVNPYGRYLRNFDLGDAQLNASFTLGLGLEYNPQAVTVNGIWPIYDTANNPDGTTAYNRKDFWRYYVAPGADLSFFFGPEKKWNVPLNFTGKFGNIIYVQGGAGLGYLGDGWSLNGTVGVSHFNDNKWSENTTFFGGLGGSF